MKGEENTLKENTLLEAFKPCSYRFGIARNGKLFIKCRFAGEIYDIEEAIVVCKEFCPFKGGFHEVGRGCRI